MPTPSTLLALGTATLLVGACASPAEITPLSAREHVALRDSVLTMFDSLGAIHTTHPDAALLRRLHPSGDTLLFVENGRLERLTGDSLARRVLTLHGPVTSMVQQFTERTALLFDRHSAWISAVETVSWSDRSGSHHYRGVLTLAVVRKDGRWFIRAYHG